MSGKPQPKVPPTLTCPLSRLRAMVRRWISSVALVDPQQPQFAVPPLDRQFPRVAHPAVDLQDAVDDLVRLHAAVQLRHRLRVP